MTLFSPGTSRLIAASRLCVWTAGLGAASVALTAGWRAMLLTVAVALGGCAALPSHVERPVSAALADTAGTRLATIAAASTSGGAGDLSGFRLLPDGGEAFEIRVALARGAEKTLDVQYYLIASDGTGLAFLRELRDAARRGVRVRVLVDDLYAAGQDELFAAFAAQGGVEVRMFNPLPARSGGFAGRIVRSLHEVARINRRMHNKLFIADAAFAVTGGRNIADEYFDRSPDANFIDMDVLSAGPVVARLAAVFDRFWNSESAFPIASLARQPQRAAAFDGRVAAIAAPAGDAIGVAAELSGGRVDLVPARFDVLADAPLRAGPAQPDGPQATVAAAHLELVRSARASVQLASPYFIPGEAAMKVLAEVRARNVEVSVLTNSLATTDEPLVHFGYARYRGALLRAGVALHELIGAPRERGFGPVVGGGSAPGGSLGRLHSKLTVVDGERLFIGSMNMDPRSARLNTEVGLVIQSPALCAELTRFLRANRRDSSYEVQLRGPQQRLSWQTGDGAGRREVAVEPGAESRTGLGLRLMAMLIDEAML